MSKRMKMKIGVEGVETKEQVVKMLSRGCDYLQGFYYSRPVPKEEYLTIMKDRITKNEII